MSRISFVPTSDWSDELRNYVAADSATDLELGITRMLAHAPELAMGVLSFGGTMATKRTLPERLIELLRLRVAFHNQCRSCMAIRYRAASADITSRRSAAWRNQLRQNPWMIASSWRLSWAIVLPVITSPSTPHFLSNSKRCFLKPKSWSC